MIYRLSLFVIFMISPTLVSANSLEQIKKYNQEYSRQLKQYLNTESADNTLIENVEHQYLHGQGIVFSIESNLSQLTKQLPGQDDKALSNELDAQVESKPKSNSHLELNELRMQAKNSAHYEFSLSKKIKSLKNKSKQASSEDQQDNIDKILRETQDEMKQVVEQRKTLAVLMNNKNMEAAMHTENSVSTPDISNAASDVNQLKQLLLKSVTLLCENNNFVEALTSRENINIVLKGNNEANQFELITVISRDTLAQCYQQQIDVNELIKSSTQYQY
ncbi:hypothetical protein CXF85_12890 [Colwellia sp. 75C3]|uniref:DUF3827 domain-containing protein n=1 Tax=Colwellia sp. 75C3 TaxID=888425 RepID=UPI000C33B063|nr:DUF3827 domain-containing protein [Colwellia sp. 75C3]PKG82381.1 hypothetical protein CXF85_12890 [Colwellia sp. 75C3]